MRIEAQGKYLQKIIEEQEKLGGVLKASETLPLPEDNNLEPSQLDTPAEALPAQSSPRKKQRTDDALADGGTSSSAQPRADEKSSFANQWDGDLCGNNAGFGLDTDFKEREGGVLQKPPLELGSSCCSE